MKYKIYYIEDDDLEIDLFEEHFGKTFSIESAMPAENFNEQIDNALKLFDIIITDYNFKGDGIDYSAEDIEKYMEKEAPDFPFLVLTNYYYKDTISKFFRPEIVYPKIDESSGAARENKDTSLLDALTQVILTKVERFKTRVSKKDARLKELIREFDKRNGELSQQEYAEARQLQQDLQRLGIPTMTRHYLDNFQELKVLTEIHNDILKLLANEDDS